MSARPSTPAALITSRPSAAAGGTASRIVGHLRSGSMLTLVQGNLHYVVTEYGIAELYGKSLRQRAEALIAIAHPAFRDGLTEFARQLNRL
ncbi:MAG TPA: acetyl-CoA hydrolase/transferase C-terminal domain-containing protein [Thermomicrobiales bacterium]|nr:acetyl-CoA hydrolase/transferase C-terminal domain-containing protein [Thermomicrobiales bacterium]